MTRRSGHSSRSSMESVPGAVATGCQSLSRVKIARRNPVAIAPGTDLNSHPANLTTGFDGGKINGHARWSKSFLQLSPRRLPGRSRADRRQPPGFNSRPENTGAGLRTRNAVARKSGLENQKPQWPGLGHYFRRSERQARFAGNFTGRAGPTG